MYGERDFLTPNSKFMKTESYSCPKKDCPYLWVSGMHVGAPPSGELRTTKGKFGIPRMTTALLCPTHRLGLVKNTERQRIEPYKGTPRMQKVRIIRK